MRVMRKEWDIPMWEKNKWGKGLKIEYMCKKIYRSQGDSLLYIFEQFKQVLPFPPISQNNNIQKQEINNKPINKPNDKPVIVNKQKNTPENGPTDTCTNCGRAGHALAKCTRCANCSKLHEAPCTQNFPTCGYCFVNQKDSKGHKTSDCKYLKVATVESLSAEIEELQRKLGAVDGKGKKEIEKG